MRIAIIVSTLLFVACSSSQANAGDCAIGKIYSDPVGTVGSKVECRARIVQVMRVSLPLGLLLETDGFKWYAELYDTKKIEPGAIRDGKIVVVRGSYLSRRKIMHNGSLVEIPSIFSEDLKGI